MAQNRAIRPAAFLKWQKDRATKILAHCPIQESFETLGEYIDVINNYQSLFVVYLSAAQVSLRYGLEEPKPYLEAATKLAEEAGLLWAKAQKAPDLPKPNRDEDFPDAIHCVMGFQWEQLPKRIDFIEFPFGLASLTSLLVHKSVPKGIEKVTPRFSQWDRHDYIQWRNYKDAGLALLILKNRKPQKWDRFLDEFSSNESAILGRSLKCYTDILSLIREKAWGKVFEKIEKAHDLFLQRGKAVHESLRAWEGPGTSNGLAIDIRLSVILDQLSKSKQRQLPEPVRIHCWSR